MILLLKGHDSWVTSLFTFLFTIAYTSLSPCSADTPGGLSKNRHQKSPGDNPEALKYSLPTSRLNIESFPNIALDTEG